ncbi:MAG: hypothetical protein J6N45_07575 [Alphaproteobacteria bacterium]|nr:hypothetical protein [Alphaproteobacteria bacterium]
MKRLLKSYREQYNELSDFEKVFVWLLAPATAQTIFIVLAALYVTIH